MNRFGLRDHLPTKDYILGRVIPEPNTGCWLWMGHVSKCGYGKATLKGTPYMAHRLAYMVFRGPIEAETLDHLCRVRCCVNPDHLEPVSHRKNMERGKWATATTCIYGHPFTDSNTKIETRKSGKARRCRECKNRTARDYRLRLRLQTGGVPRSYKLNSEAAKVIRHFATKRLGNGVLLAKMFHVSPAVVSEIASRKLWRGV